jgi:FkbM family methyltransferase
MLTLKNTLRSLTPPFIWNIGRKISNGNRPTGLQQDYRIAELHQTHKELNATTPFGSIKLRRNIELKIHPDCYTSFHAFCFSYPDMVAELDFFLKIAKEKRRFLDIGSLHGIFSLAFAKLHPEGKCIAADPSPFAFSKLLYNIHKNSLNHINPHEIALSSHNRNLQMHYVWEHAVSAGTDSTTMETINVSAITGDELCQSHHFEPDLIKIDVEGHELEVLKGLEKIVEMLHPEILLELHPTNLRLDGGSVNEVISFFKNFDYLPYSLTSDQITYDSILNTLHDQRIYFK